MTIDTFEEPNSLTDDELTEIRNHVHKLWSKLDTSDEGIKTFNSFVSLLREVDRLRLKEKAFDIILKIDKLKGTR